MLFLNLQSTIMASKPSTHRQYSLFGLFKLDAFTERMLRKKQEDPFLVMEREFQRLQKKNIQPVVIIDEFHKLDGLYMPDKQKRLIIELMNFFVAMTKEGHLCHVIIASSDAFFIEQVYVDSKLRKTSKFMKLDYLEKEDIFTWLSDIRKYNKVKEYTLNREDIELIWDTVGGSAWEIYSILEDMFQHSLDSIISKIKREKVAMITDWIFRDPEGQRERVLARFTDTSVSDIRAFSPEQLYTLGQAVKDNILYYDPGEGEYGIQGRSLEWGIKGYFNQV